MNNKLYFVDYLSEYPDICLYITKSFDLYIVIYNENIAFNVTSEEIKQFINKDISLNQLYIFKILYNVNSEDGLYKLEYEVNEDIPEKYKNIKFNDTELDKVWLETVTDRLIYGKTDLFIFRD